MAEKVADRFAWAANLLDVKPAERLLEIGCGHGIMATLLCERLDAGRITGIDRSATMIRMAEKRNSRCVALGKARFHAMDLKNADLEGGRYDKVFAINVNVFWQRPDEELSAVRRLVAPEGSLYLFFQPPISDKAAVIMQKLKGILQQRDFSIEHEAIEELPSGAAVYARAKPSGGSTGYSATRSNQSDRGQ